MVKPSLTNSFTNPWVINSPFFVIFLEPTTAIALESDFKTAPLIANCIFDISNFLFVIKSLTGETKNQIIRVLWGRQPLILLLLVQPGWLQLFLDYRLEQRL